ncbi:MAG: hypothetical protein QMD71_00495 [bacterium]|nr:hypothetical protein [bacterium]
MKKVSLLVIAVIFVATMGFATNTRVATMGGWSDFLIDDSNIYGYPAWVNAYAGNVIGELGATGAFPTLGAFFKGRILPVNYGVALQRSAFPALVNTAITNSGAQFTPGFVAPLPQLEFVGGAEFGPLAAGLDVELASNAISIDVPHGDTMDMKESMGIIGIRPGVKFALGEKNFVDFALGIRTHNWSLEECDLEGVKYKWNAKGKLFYGIDTRAFFTMSEKTLISLLHLNIGDASWERATIDTTSEELKLMDVTLGVGGTHPIFENGTLLFGLVGRMDKETTTPEDTTKSKTAVTITTLPGIVFGAEAQIWSWLGARVGFWKYLNPVKMDVTPQSGADKDKATTITTFNAPFNLAFGACAKLGDFTFDVQIPNAFFFSGPYLISGTPCAAALASLTYTFGK